MTTIDPPTGPSADEPTPAEPTPTELTPTELTPAELVESTPARRRRTSLVAGTLVVVLLGAGVGLIASSGSDRDSTARTASGEPQPLSLQPAAAAEANAASDAAVAPGAKLALWGGVALHHSGPWPATPTEATVYRLVGTSLDAASLTAMAEAAGIGPVRVEEIDGGGLNAVGPTTVVSAYPYAGLWSISMYPSEMLDPQRKDASVDAGGGSSDSSTGGGSSSDSTESSTGSSETSTDSTGRVLVDGTTGDGQVVPAPADTPQPPADLPSEAEAERIARDLLDAIGATDEGEWTFTVSEGMTYGAAVSCASDAPDCTSVETDPVVTERAVQATRVVDGRPVSGLDWYVSIGDGGAITSLYGTLAGIEAVTDYPLRSVDSVYQDVVDGKGFYGGVMPMTAEKAGATGEATPATAGDQATSDQAGVGVTVAPDMMPYDPCMGEEPAVRDQITVNGEPLDPATADTVPDCTPPAPVDVDVTGVSVAYQVIPGWQDGTEVSYLVPTYRFSGAFRNGDGDWTTELVAIESDLIAPPPPVVEEPPAEAPAPPPTKAVPAP